MTVTQPSRNTAVLTGQLLSTGGQNPTVKIRWGDEDRGKELSPSVAWDNEVTVSTNQAAGSFSTTITIPNLEKVYYFRAVASNAGGTVVSNKVGVFVPSAPVGVANLQGRWSFDGGNANDSSGKTRHGVAKKFLEPSEISNLALWLDASDTSSISSDTSNLVSQWNDKSGNNYHATAPSGAEPTTGSANINGKNVLSWGRYIKMNRATPTNANWQDVYIFACPIYHKWSSFTDVPTIMSGITSANSDNGIAGGANSGNGFWINLWTDNFYLNGTANNGTNVVETMSSPFLVSLF